MIKPIINSFDFDGVIFIERGLFGVRPGPEDVIITGRSIEEALVTHQQMGSRGIKNQVFFNPLPYLMKTRETSGQHKATVLRQLWQSGYDVAIHFEDDPIQADIIEKEMEIWKINTSVVRLVHNLTEKENVWHSPE